MEGLLSPLPQGREAVRGWQCPDAGSSERSQERLGQADNSWPRARLQRAGYEQSPRLQPHSAQGWGARFPLCSGERGVIMPF